MTSEFHIHLADAYKVRELPCVPDDPAQPIQVLDPSGHISLVHEQISDDFS